MARFMRKGITKIFFVPTIATPASPTAVEVNAGTNLTPEINEISGFQYKNNPIDTPDLATTTVSKISGEDTLDNSSLTFYEQKSADAIKTALAKGTVGYIVIFYSGTAGAIPALGDKAEVWKVDVASNTRQYNAGNEAAKFVVEFTNTVAPVEATLV